MIFHVGNSAISLLSGPKSSSIRAIFYCLVFSQKETGVPKENVQYYVRIIFACDRGEFINKKTAYRRKRQPTSYKDKEHCANTQTT